MTTAETRESRLAGRAVAAPELAEDAFRLAFEHAALGMAIVGTDGCLLRVNRSAGKMLGYEPEELLGRTFQDVTYPDDIEVGLELLDELLTGRREYGWLEKRYVRKDGTVIWALLSTAVVRDSQGHLLYLISEIQDVTDKVAADQTLAARVADRTRELAALYDVTAVASASLDLETVMARSLDRVLDVMGCGIGGIHLVDEAAGEVRLAAWRNIPAEVRAEIGSMPVGSGVAGRIIAQDAPLVVSAMGDDPDAAPAARRLLDRSVYVGAPMRAKGRAVGVLGVIGVEGQPFGAESVALLASIADQVGVAVENARLYQQAERLAVVEERHRLARELHDQVTQSLYSARLLTEAARRAAGRTSGAGTTSEEVVGYLDELSEITQQAMKEMRLLIHQLRPPALAQVGLVGALQRRIDAVEGRAGVKARLLLAGELTLTPALEAALYGIGQEALNNALKHAAADAVTVRLRAADGLVEMTVTDDGRGFDPDGDDALGGMGLTSMRERAEQVGGTLIVDSAPGRGTTVTMTVREPEADRASVTGGRET